MMLSLKPLLLLCVTKIVAFDKSEVPLLCYKVLPDRLWVYNSKIQGPLIIASDLLRTRAVGCFSVAQAAIISSMISIFSGAEYLL